MDPYARPDTWITPYEVRGGVGPFLAPFRMAAAGRTTRVSASGLGVPVFITKNTTRSILMVVISKPTDVLDFSFQIGKSSGGIGGTIILPANSPTNHLNVRASFRVMPGSSLWMRFVLGSTEALVTEVVP